LPAKLGFKKVLVAVDGSDVSMRAVQYASRIAKCDGADLYALHVIPAPQVEIEGELADYYDQARRPAKKWMKDVEGIAASHGLGIRTEILVGAYSVVDAILGYAESTSADLIVTGTRGRTPHRRMLMGSVASALVEYASCPVLVVR